MYPFMFNKNWFFYKPINDLIVTLDKVCSILKRHINSADKIIIIYNYLKFVKCICLYETQNAFLFAKLIGRDK